jgi:hypothetical protein
MLVSSLTLRNDLEESLPVKQNGLTQTKIKV